MIKEAIILAGGFGTRLAHIVSDVPKPMALVAGLPFLTYILSNLQKAGIDHVILCTGYKSYVISDYYRNSFSSIEYINFTKQKRSSTSAKQQDSYTSNEQKNLNPNEDITKRNFPLEKLKAISIDYSIEETPLGTGGAVKAALNKLKGDEFFLLNGDTFFDIDYNKFFNEYINNPSILYLALSQQDDTSRYGTVIIDDNRNVLEFCEKGKNSGYGLINGGIYIVNKNIFSQTETPTCFSFENEILEKHYKNLNIKGLKFNSYFIDIGIPKDYFKAQEYFGQKYVDKLNLLTTN